MFFFISLSSSSSFLGNLQCGICKKKLSSSKENLTELFDSLDYTKQCSQLTPKSLKLCRSSAPLIFKTFFSIAPAEELCSIVRMCNFSFPKSLKPKEESQLTREDLRNKKYKSQCDLLHDLIEYLLHNGLEEYTIPTFKSLLSSMSSDNPIASMVSKKIDNRAISRFARSLTAKYTAAEFVQETGVCGEL